MRERVVWLEAQGGRRGREAWTKMEVEADSVLSESQTSRIIHLLRSTQSSSPTLRISLHNPSAKTLRPAGSCCLRLGTCTQPFEVFNERRRTYALPLALNQRPNMQKLFNDTRGNSTLLYANAAPLALSLRDQCPAIDAPSSNVYTFKTGVLAANGYFNPGLLQALAGDSEGKPACASTHIPKSCGKLVVRASLVFSNPM